MCGVGDGIVKRAEIRLGSGGLETLWVKRVKWAREPWRDGTSRGPVTPQNRQVRCAGGQGSQEKINLDVLLEDLSRATSEVWQVFLF